MIDLGVELDGYGETVAVTQTVPSGADTVRLADLQAQGFNTEPPWPGFDPSQARTDWLGPYAHVPVLHSISADPRPPGFNVGNWFGGANL